MKNNHLKITNYNEFYFNQAKKETNFSFIYIINLESFYWKLFYYIFDKNFVSNKFQVLLHRFNKHFSHLLINWYLKIKNWKIMIPHIILVLSWRTIHLKIININIHYIMFLFPISERGNKLFLQLHHKFWKLY